MEYEQFRKLPFLEKIEGIINAKTNDQAKIDSIIAVVNDYNEKQVEQLFARFKRSEKNLSKVYVTPAS